MLDNASNMFINRGRGPSAGSKIGGGIGQAAGTFFGGPIGGAIGKLAGQALGSLVENRPSVKANILVPVTGKVFFCKKLTKASNSVCKSNKILCLTKLLFSN